jgi:hypothetical protein
MEPVSSNSTTALTLTELANDSSFKILSSSVAKEALLKTNPSIAVFVLDERKFTIVNHTDQCISILKCWLCINEIAISKISNDDCQIIAYHLEDHPEIICFDEKKISDSKPNLRICTELTWKDAIFQEAFRNLPRGSKLDVNFFASKETTPALSLNFKLPASIEENIKKNLMLIMQEISPDAILSSEPRWITSNGTNSRILNFTSHELTFNKNNELMIDNQKIFIKKILSLNNYCMIAYHVNTYSHTICLDVKDDNNTNLMDRIFLTKDMLESSTDTVWLSIYAHRCENVIEFKNLFKLQTTCPQDPKEYMKSNNDIKALVERIHLKAALIDTPQVALYKGRLSKDIGCIPVTIVNHTNQNIRLDVNNRLYIDNSIVDTYMGGVTFNSQIIAYHLKDESQRILFEQRIQLGAKAKMQRIMYSLSWVDCLKSKSDAICEEIRKKRTFKQLWLAKQDEKSVFNKFPKEILEQIIHLHLQI